MQDALYTPYLSRMEAAHYLGVSGSTLARWAMLGEGPRFHKVGGKARYKIADLDTYIDSKAVEPARANHQQL